MTDELQGHWSYNCEHKVFEVRSRVNAVGVVTHVRQCVRCGRNIGSVKRQGTAPPFDESLRERVRADAEAFYRRRGEESRRERDLMLQERRLRRQIEYRQYLASADWQHKRGIVLRRCDRVCEACGVAVATEVHHVAYPQRFGDEPLWDLRGVCRSCHARIHGRDE